MTRDKIPQTETFSHLFLTLSSHCELGRRPQKSRPKGNTAGQKIRPCEGRHCHPLPNRRLTISLGRPTPQAAPIVREASRLEKAHGSSRRRNEAAFSRRSSSTSAASLAPPSARTSAFWPRSSRASRAQSPRGSPPRFPRPGARAESAGLEV